MQHVLIVEDNQAQLDMLVSTISKEYPTWTIDSCKTYSKAKEYINKSKFGISKPYNLFLLDIQLTDYETDRGGFLLAEEIRSIPIYYRTNILFLTGISDSGTYALSNFHCYNYITKPYTEKDILNQLEQMIITGYLENFFMITDNNRIIHKLKTSDITYIHAARHLKTINLVNSQIHTRLYSFDDFISLTNGELIKCHKGYLVNPKHITSFDKVTYSIMVNDSSIPIGRTYVDTIQDYMQK